VPLVAIPPIPETVLIFGANEKRLSLKCPKIDRSLLGAISPLAILVRNVKSPSVGAERLEMILVEEPRATPFSILSIQRYISLGLFHPFYLNKET
jgi:hypothetical protein